MAAHWANWGEVLRLDLCSRESLLAAATTADAAVVVIQPEIDTHDLNEDSGLSRGNVLMGLGVLSGLLGRRRTAIVRVQTAHPPRRAHEELDGVSDFFFDQMAPEASREQLTAWLHGLRGWGSRESSAFGRAAQSMQDTLGSIPQEWQAEIDRYVVSAFLSSLRLAGHGQIVLTIGQYYQAIYDEMDRATAPSEVVGVATLSSLLWTDDRDQQRYVTKNLQAAHRGAIIRRLFIVPDQEWPKLSDVVRRQIEAGVAIRRAKPTILAEAKALEDMVVFVDSTDGDSRAYAADSAFDNPSKIRRARLVLDADHKRAMMDDFERVWATAAVVTLRDLAKTAAPSELTPEPARDMKEYSLDRPVVTCEEAASAKGINLENELKTAILSTQKGFVALHVPGNARVGLRKVKNALEVKEACLATPEELSSLGLLPGTVCAVKDPVWRLPHLISKRLLGLTMVSTNNGTRRGFYRFHPSTLLEADSVMIGDFEFSDEGDTVD